MSIYVIRWINDEGKSAFLHKNSVTASDWLNSINTLCFSNKQVAKSFINTTTNKYMGLKDKLFVVTWQQARDILNEDIQLARLEVLL